MFRLSRDMAQKIDLSLSIVLQHFWTYWGRKLPSRAPVAHLPLFSSTPERCWLRVISTVKSVFLLLCLCISSRDSCQKNCMLSLVNFHVHLLSPSDMKLHVKQILTWLENCKSVPALWYLLVLPLCAIGLCEDRVNLTECRHLPSLTFNRPHFSLSKISALLQTWQDSFA